MTMDHRPETDTALEQRIARVLKGTAEFKAPAGLEARVLKDIERGAKAAWWQRRVPEWPPLAQLLFILSGIAAALALLLSRPATPKALVPVISQPAAILNHPAADLHATLDVLAAFHRIGETLVGTVTDGVWYGGMALCAAAYVAMFCLIAFGYRLLHMPAAR
jgi:hypothetical protein